MRSTSTPSLARYWPAGVVAAFAVLVAVAMVLDAKDRVEVADARDARQGAGQAVLAVVQAIAQQIDEAEDGAAPGTRDVGLTDPDGPSAAAAAQARDTARPALDNTSGGVIVVARYDAPAPVDVASRRAGLVGYSLTPLRLGSTLDALKPERTQLHVLGPLGRVMGTQDAAAGKPPTGTAVAFRLPVDQSVAPGWNLESRVAPTSVPTSTWLTAALVLLAGLLAAWQIVRRTRRNEAERAQALRHRQSEATVAELATVSQSSLDLAEVLPASFAVLETALNLGGVALLSTDARPTFVWRDAPTPDEPARPLEAPVPAGCCLDVPLGRGGRSLGALRLRPQRELDEVDIRTLSGAAETLSSAVANADAYAQQRAMITRMRSLDDLKTVFVATASHELRTPVAAVIGYANMLVENWDSLDSETGLLYAQRVDSNATRLAALVEHLLDFSRLEQGGSYKGEKLRLDLGEEVQSLSEGLNDLIEDHELVVKVQPGVMVAGSKLAVERVLTNLVGNAAKYSPAGTIIRVRVTRDHAAHLIVDDEGPGIPEQEREQVFSRFFRGKGDEVVRTRGAGLGLSIVTEFATSMGGEVSTSVAPTGGARFEVTYPLHDPSTVDVDPGQGDTHVPA